MDFADRVTSPCQSQDGGDVEFDRFDNDSGVLYLRMIGACPRHVSHWADRGFRAMETLNRTEPIIGLALRG